MKSSVLGSFGTYPMVALNNRKQKLRAQGITIFDYGTGDPKIPCDAEIIRAFHDSVPAVSQYPTVTGSWELRETFSQWFEKRFKVSLDPQTQLLSCSGSKESIFHAPFAHIDSKSERPGILVPNPAYSIYESGSKFCGATVFHFPLRSDNGYVLDPEDLDLETVKQSSILWINYPNNPTGAVASRAQLQKIVDFCKEHKLILFSDECYTEIFDKNLIQAPTSILELTQENVLVFQSLSKRSGMTGFRSGFICGDPKLIAIQKSMRAMVGVASTHFVQGAAQQAWSDSEHVKKRCHIFAERRQPFVEFFNKQNLSFCGLEATLYLWVKLPTDLDADSYANTLLEKGIVVSPGHYFGSAGTGHIRLSLVPEIDAVIKTIELWETAIFEGLHKTSQPL
jgi:succinyldiaminopimelate transaminase